jgi:hypothetical protein
VKVQITSSPVFSLAALTARQASSTALIVSMQTASAPPLSRARTCSRKASYSSSSLTSPVMRICPVGPTDAITQRESPAALREMRAAASLIS